MNHIKKYNIFINEINTDSKYHVVEVSDEDVDMISDIFVDISDKWNMKEITDQSLFTKYIINDDVTSFWHCKKMINKPIVTLEVIWSKSSYIDNDEFVNDINRFSKRIQSFGYKEIDLSLSSSEKNHSIKLTIEKTS